MVKVKYITDNTIDTEDFCLCLNNANRQYDNSSITFKVMLYLVSLLTDNGLNDNTCIILTDGIQRKLSISNINSFKGSLDYISSLTFNYKLDKINKWQYVDNIFVSYTQFKGYFKVVFSDEFITLLDRSKQFYQVPKGLLNSDIRYYRNSIFMANYILLHQRRNMRQDKEKYRHTISVAKLLDNSPFIPKYEELDTRQRKVSKCIIKPFESNLNFIIENGMDDYIKQQEDERRRDREFIELFKRNYNEIVRFIEFTPHKRIPVNCFTYIKGMDLSKQYGKPK